MKKTPKTRELTACGKCDWYKYAGDPDAPKDPVRESLLHRCKNEQVAGHFNAFDAKFLFETPYGGYCVHLNTDGHCPGFTPKGPKDEKSTNGRTQAD